MHNAMRCPHGYSEIDADECDQCLALEAAKIDVLRETRIMLETYTPPEASGMRARLLTAAGIYVSMKLHDWRQKPVVLGVLREIIRVALPAPNERLLVAEQFVLVELSFEAHAREDHNAISF